jgi:hypothetical protein
MDFPKTVIISVTCHGRLLTKRGSIKKIKFTTPPSPSGTELHKITFNPLSPNGKLFYVNSSDIGVTNFLTEHSNDEINKLITNEIAKLKTEPDQQFVELIMEKLKTYHKKTINEEMTNDLEYYGDIDFKEFIHTFDRSYNLRVYNQNETLFNKLFSSTKIENELYNFKVKILNMKKDNLDLDDDYNLDFDFLTSSSANESINDELSVYLHEILLFLTANGVENIIIFDFSCNSLYDHNKKNEITPRSKRIVRRTFTAENSPFYLKDNTKKRKNTLNDHNNDIAKILLQLQTVGSLKSNNNKKTKRVVQSRKTQFQPRKTKKKM